MHHFYTQLLVLLVCVGAAGCPGEDEIRPELRGTLLDEDDTPVAGALMIVCTIDDWFEYNAEECEREDRQETDGDGKFVFEQFIAVPSVVDPLGESGAWNHWLLGCGSSDEEDGVTFISVYEDVPDPLIVKFGNRIQNEDAPPPPVGCPD